MCLERYAFHANVKRVLLVQGILLLLLLLFKKVNTGRERFNTLSVWRPARARAETKMQETKRERAARPIKRYWLRS